MKRRPSSEQCQFRKLRLERLESRNLLAITVNTPFDEADGSITDGDVSLRDAIALALPNDTIDFSPALTADGPATIRLELGVLSISQGVRIQGPGSSLLTIDASGNDPTPGFTLADIDLTNDGDGTRIFQIGVLDATNPVFLSGLTLTGGDTTNSGGAIYSNDATLSIQNCVITGNQALDNGGALAANGHSGSVIRIENTRIENNATLGSGQGLDIRVSGDSKFYLTDSVVRENGYSDEFFALGILGGGLSINVSNGALAEITRSVITGNITGETGGGIYVVNQPFLGTGNGGTFRVLQSTLSGNSAGLTLASVSGHSNGGGIFIRTGEANSAAHTHNLIRDSTISDNIVRSRGGGIAIHREGFAYISIVNSTISGNQSTHGGGISVLSYDELPGAIQIAHSTVARNVSYEDDPGGPFPSPSGVGGGISLPTDLAIIATKLDHTIVAENEHIRDGATVYSPDISTVSSTVPLSADYSLIGNPSGIGVPISGIGNLIGEIANLGPLTNNGGLTLTHLPQAGSRAIDAGDSNAIAGSGTVPDFDQRGVAYGRVVDIPNVRDPLPDIDIGAVEVQLSDPRCNLIGDYSRNGTVDAADYTIWRDHLGSQYFLPNEDPTATPGIVTDSDYSAWRERFGESCDVEGSGSSSPYKSFADGLSRSDIQGVDQLAPIFIGALVEGGIGRKIFVNHRVGHPMVDAGSMENGLLNIQVVALLTSNKQCRKYDSDLYDCTFHTNSDNANNTASDIESHELKYATGQLPAEHERINQ